VLTFALLRQLRERLFLQRKAAELARYPLQNSNPVLTVTPAGRKLFMNDAARQLFDSVHGGDAAQLDREVRSLATASNAGIREFAIGTHIMSASFIPHAPDYCDIYLTDVTSVRQDENLLQLFFSLPFIGMAITSPETKHWLRFNDRLCEILGYPRTELERKSWAELTHPDDLAADVAEFERVMRGETDGYAMDKRFIRPDGAVVDAAIDVHAVRRPDRSIEIFVATIQDITERKQAERRLLEQRNLYAALTATGEAMIRLRDREALFQQVCEVAVMHAGLAFAWVGLVDAAKQQIRPVARHGDDRSYIDSIDVRTDPALPEGRGPAGRLITTGKHQVVNDVAADPTLAPWLDNTSRTGIRALAVFPIRQGGALIATLHLYSHQRGHFSADIVSLLDEMVANLSFALDKLHSESQRAMAMAELQKAEARWQFALEGGDHGVWEWNIPAGTVFYSPRWITMLGYAPGEISNSLDEWKSRIHPDDWARVETEIQRYFDGVTPNYSCEHRVRCKDGSYKWILDHGKVTARDAAGAPLMMIGTHTDVSSQKQAELALAESEQKFKALVEQSLIGIYMVDEENLIYVNPRAAEIFGYEPEELSNVSLANVIVPEDRELVRDNIRRRTSGVIETLRYEFHGLRKDGKIIDIGVHGSRTMLGDRPVVLGVLQDITDKRLHEERVREYVQRLERSITSTVQAISHMVDLRDPYTAGHERRVGELAAAIGAEIGLSEHQINGLRIAGDVHDVGKIAVPAEILSKPTRLSEAEFAIVKTHAQQGYEILKDIDFPWPVAQTVWQHHERLDGSGYPRGLHGDEICLEARIMAVADVVESMSTHRPYRPALGLDAAFAELQAKTGTLYDADIVAACVRLFRNKGYTLPE
jgi:PAS domain S-box-containing protein